MSLILSLFLLQVGPNSAADTSLRLPEELVNRPERPGGTNNPASEWFETCLDQLQSDAARAHSQAQIRLLEVSGPERIITNHCLGLAATELGLWDDARAAFIEARDETPETEPRTRARFGLMAGNAALIGGDPATAIDLLAAARVEAQTAASATLEALAAMDSARALVLLDRPNEAITALATATRLEPEKAEGWLLTATLFRRLERLDDAQQAIEQAARLSPTEAQIGLEAGVIAVLSGRDDAARQSWESVISTQPDSLAAQTARGYLDQLGPAAEDTP